MEKYIIVKEWLGSKSVGSIIELEKLHPSLAANVRKVGAEDTSEADSKKEMTALKSKLTKTENALKEAEEQNAMLQGRIIDLENEVISLTEPKKEDKK